MRVVFMGKHKRSAARALAWLVERGCDVSAVVAEPPDELTHPEQRVDLVAERLGLRQCDDQDLYAEPPAELDLVVSFLFPRRILAPLIELPRLGCLNFHPAPLPDLRGVGGYNVAILEGRPDWGVSAHFVDENFDTGDLVAVRRFPIDAERETAWSLDLASQERLLDLFEEVVGLLLEGRELPREPQGDGRYVSRAELEELRRVPRGAGAAEIERHIRAFWYPPWPGATIDLDGRPFTLVDERTLREIAAALRDAGRLP
jgi:methionyl-tRNA formyltransferase